jgi:hypothetical protein
MIFRNFFLGLLLLCLAAPATAEIFSCTDKQGKKHVADTLMRLPAECRNQADTLDLKDQGNVNYVPPTKAPPGSGAAFRNAVNAEAKARQQRDQEVQDLLLRARRAANIYQVNRTGRRNEVRTKKSGFRQRVMVADEAIESSRREKQSILQEARQVDLKQEEQKELKEILQKIE